MIENKGLRIAFTGRRNVGKSTAVTRLQMQGFVQIHAFTGGKKAAVTYLDHILDGGPYSRMGYRMVYGNLKDTPCPALPGGVAPRKFLEGFGRFMGIDMGVEWTLKAEVDRAKRLHGNDVNIAVDSMVYESDYWRDIGGVIVRLNRPDFEGQPVVDSDKVQAEISHDFEYFAETPEQVEENIDYLLKSLLTKQS
jgi:hypothetical protein